MAAQSIAGSLAQIQQQQPQQPQPAALPATPLPVSAGPAATSASGADASTPTQDAAVPPSGVGQRKISFVLQEDINAVTGSQTTLAVQVSTYVQLQYCCERMLDRRKRMGATLPLDGSLIDAPLVLTVAAAAAASLLWLR